MFYYDTLEIAKNKKIKVLKSTLLNGIEHFFTTRDFVLTAGTLDNMLEEAENNRQLLCDFLKIDKSQLYIPQQTHGCNVKVLNGDKNDLSETDAVISNIKNSVILLNFADCTPIIMYDTINRAGAIVHAGWRGCAASILQKTVKKFVENFGTNPSDLVSAIGPSIGSCCYCTDEDVYYKIKKTVNNNDATLFGKAEFSSGIQKYYIDLKNVNKVQLEEVFAGKIDKCDICTSCSNNLYFSYRKEKGKTARHNAVIKI